MSGSKAKRDTIDTNNFFTKIWKFTKIMIFAMEPTKEVGIAH